MTSSHDGAAAAHGGGRHPGAHHAVVLAGGAASRLGGADKPALDVGGRALLDRVLAACAGAATTVVVGPRRPTDRPVRWTREDPPGGGPVPALAAGLGALPADDGVVLVLAADLPFLTADTVRALLRALTPGAGEPDGPDGPDAPGPVWEGALLTDGGGRDQPLAAAYRIEPLRRELALLKAEHGRLAGLPLRLLARELTLRRVTDPSGDASFDCDTWEDVAAARARLDGAGQGESLPGDAGPGGSGHGGAGPGRGSGQGSGQGEDAGLG